MAAWSTGGGGYIAAGNRSVLEALFSCLFLLTCVTHVSVLMCAASKVSLEGQVVTCRPSKGNSDQWIAFVHGSQHEVLFKCEGGTPVPSGLVKPGARQFCDVDLNASDCERAQADAAKFVPGAKEDWFSGTDLKTGVKFSIPEEDYPSVYRGFRIGCVTGKKEVKSCMVTVHVQARDPEVDGQVARCAYSNDLRTQRLSLTPEKNQVTLICGREGRPLPDNFEVEFCQDSSRLDVCESRRFSTIFPTFDPKWWSRGKSGVTLTIPPHSFPREAKKFNLVCRNFSPEAEGEQHNCVVGVDVSPGTARDGGRPSTKPAGRDTVGPNPATMPTVPSGGSPNPQGSNPGGSNPQGAGSAGSDPQSNKGRQGGQDAQESNSTSEGKMRKSGAYRCCVEGILSILVFVAGIAVSSFLT